MPSLVGYIREGAVMIVMVESTTALLALNGHGDGGGVSEIDIGPSVAIVVDEDHAAAHRLDDVLLLGGDDVAKGDAGLLRDVVELRDGAIHTLDLLHSGRRRRRRRMSTLSPGAENDLRTEE